MKGIVAIFAAVLVSLLQGGFADARAANSGGHCTAMTITDYVESDATDTSNSYAWTNLTDARLNLTTSGTGCVIITFSGMAAVGTDGQNYNTLHVRTLLDGHNLCMPPLASDTFLNALILNSQWSANSITRICKNVAAGAHTVQAQFHDGSTDAPVQIQGHVLTVTHN